MLIVETFLCQFLQGCSSAVGTSSCQTLRLFNICSVLQTGSQNDDAMFYNKHNDVCARCTILLGCPNIDLTVHSL